MSIESKDLSPKIEIEKSVKSERTSEELEKIWEEKQAETEPMTKKESAEELTPEDIDRLFEMHGKAVDADGKTWGDNSSTVQETKTDYAKYRPESPVQKLEENDESDEALLKNEDLELKDPITYESEQKRYKAFKDLLEENDELHGNLPKNGDWTDSAISAYEEDLKNKYEAFKIERPLHSEFKSRKEKLKSKMTQETVLKNYEKQSSTELSCGANESAIIELKNDGSGVFKSKDGEKQGLRDFVKAGTYYKRERAAYLVDKFLGFDLVPPTVIRKIDDQIGSLQQFIPDTKAGCEIQKDDLVKKDAMRREIAKLNVFDYIIYNSDRHGANFLVEFEQNKIHAIDNGLSFGRDSLRMVTTYDLADFSSLDWSVSPEVTKNLQEFLVRKEEQKMFTEQLSTLLNEYEIESCMKRIEKISKMLEENGAMNNYGSNLNLPYSAQLAVRLRNW